MRGRMIMLAAGMKMGEQRAQQQAQAQSQQQEAIEQAKHQGAEEAMAQPAPVPATATPGSGSDMTAQLQKLADLHQSGILTDDEFAAAKKKALGI